MDSRQSSPALDLILEYLTRCMATLQITYRFFETTSRFSVSPSKSILSGGQRTISDEDADLLQDYLEQESNMGPVLQFELALSPTRVPPVHGMLEPFPHLQLRLKEFRPELMKSVLLTSPQICLKCFIIGYRFPRIDFETLRHFMTDFDYTDCYQRDDASYTCALTP